MNLPFNLQNIIRMQYLTGVNGNKNIPNKNEVSANQIIVAYTTNTNEYQNFGHFSTSGSSFFAVLPINLLYFFSQPFSFQTMKLEYKFTGNSIKQKVLITMWVIGGEMKSCFDTGIDTQ